MVVWVCLQLPTMTRLPMAIWGFPRRDKICTFMLSTSWNFSLLKIFGICFPITDGHFSVLLEEKQTLYFSWKCFLFCLFLERNIDFRYLGPEEVFISHFPSGSSQDMEAFSEEGGDPLTWRSWAQAHLTSRSTVLPLCTQDLLPSRAYLQW